MGSFWNWVRSCRSSNSQGVPVRYMQNLIKSLYAEFKSISERMHLFIVIPPYHSYHQEELFSEYDLMVIVDYVDGLSLMTYDYSISPSGGPNAPIQWMADNGLFILVNGSCEAGSSWAL